MRVLGSGGSDCCLVELWAGECGVWWSRVEGEGGQLL